MDLANNRRAVLRCENLTVRFGGVVALKDVSLDFPEVGAVGIIGPNGAGKTTLFNAISGFIEVNAGRCYLGSEDITGASPERVAQLGIARTFQEVRLIRSVPALENVMLARRGQTGENLMAALFGFGIAREERRNRKEAVILLRVTGLMGCARQNAGELSFGQQKLLTVACCLASKAPILLLDEPMAGLHPEFAERMLVTLSSLREPSRLIVFIEHNLAAVRRLAHWLIVMHEGKIVGQGPTAEVLARPDVMGVYLG